MFTCTCNRLLYLSAARTSCGEKKTSWLRFFLILWEKVQGPVTLPKLLTDSLYKTRKHHHVTFFFSGLLGCLFSRHQVNANEPVPVLLSARESGLASIHIPAPSVHKGQRRSTVLNTTCSPASEEHKYMLERYVYRCWRRLRDGRHTCTLG